MNDTTDTKPVAKSIIDPKYRGKRADDWLSEFVDSQVKVPVMKKVSIKDAEGNVTGSEEVPSARSTIDLPRLFGLCRANAIDPAEMEKQVDRPNAAGRIRMTLGNSLRAAARKRHGLRAVDGDWCEAPAAFVGDTAKTEHPDGTKIAVAKPVAAEPVAAEAE